ncbi:MAG: hypothetical protein ABIO82_07020 [Ginsengibacter sp.]
MKFFIQLFFLLSFQFVHAQDISGLLKEAANYESTMNDEQAVSKYKEVLKISPDNLVANCKASELSSRIGARYNDDKKKQATFYTSAKTYAETAFRLNQQSSEANFVMALMMGREAMERGGKEKISAVKNIKIYADRAIKADPSNYKAWFILGKWYYEVSSLNYFQKTAVKVFFGAFADATVDDAIRCFEKSKALNPTFVLNYLSLAKAYEKKDNNDLAKQNLSVMISLPDNTPDDQKIKSEGRELFRKLN